MGSDGKLASTPYDSNVGREHLKMTLGGGNVVKGWEEGMVGMKRGAKRLIIIPPQLAFGATGRPPVPPNATIALEVVSSLPIPSPSIIAPQPLRLGLTLSLNVSKVELNKVRRPSEQKAVRSRTSSASPAALPPVLFPNSPAPDISDASDMTDDEEEEAVNSSQVPCSAHTGLCRLVLTHPLPLWSSIPPLPLACSNCGPT